MSSSPRKERSWIDATALGAGGLFIAALFLFAMDAFAHLQLSPKQLGWCWTAWIPATLLSIVLARRSVPAWVSALGELLVAAVCLNFLSRWQATGFSLATVIYVAVGVQIFTLAWRGGLRTACADSARVGEAIRFLALGAVAVWLTRPMFTDLLVGGVDARWYSDVLDDFLRQVRSGIFPVHLGQGEVAFNGTVHPFRSAPVYQHVAALWDLLTFRTLSAPALAHLTIVSAAFAAIFAMYAVLNVLVPRKRWIATAVAAIYVSSPAFLSTFFISDQYLTFIAMAVMPVVVYANVVIIRDGGTAGWIWLAAGLSAMWLTHPPQAVLTCLVTLGIQGGRLVLSDQPLHEWGRAVFGALLFGLLSCSYLLGISQVPSPFKPSYVLMAMQLVGVCLALAGIAFILVWKRGWWSWIVFAAGLALLWSSRPVWMWTVLVAAAIAALFVAIAKKRKTWDPATGAWSVIAGAALVTGFLVPIASHPAMPPDNAPVAGMLQQHAASLLKFFAPVGPKLGVVSDFQPGWGVWFLVGGLAWSALVWRSLVSRLLLIAAFLLVISCLRVPVLSEFWGVFQPRALVAMLGFPLPNRMFPPLAAVACVGGFCWLAELANRRALMFGAMTGVTFVLAGWSLAQARFFATYSAGQTQSRSETEKWARSENASLGQYAWELMMFPANVSNGKMDPRLESRLRLGEVGVVGPDQIARRMEEVGRSEQTIVATVEPTAPTWLNLSPALVLQPGEHVLLRFEFLPKAYNGYLIFKSDHIYREYQLPESGWPAAFGSKTPASKTLSLWNSGATAETVKLSFMRLPPGDRGEFGDFGKMIVSHYQPELAPVRTLSLIPYRVEADLPVAGWLETPRVFLPGYRAWVDGVEAPVSESSWYLARVPVPAGRHRVEMKFTGTPLWNLTRVVSGLTWFVLIGGLTWRAFTRRSASASATPA